MPAPFLFLSPYQKGRSNPIAKLRAVSDELHLELNRMRREREAPHIATMPETRHRKKKEAGLKSLSEQLSSLEDVTPSNLPAYIESLGHTVTRHNQVKGTISVIHQDKKKAHRYSIEALLAEALALRSLRVTPLPNGDLSLPDIG